MGMMEGFPGGGVMGERVRTHDWAATPLGPAETWPQSLRTALSIMLSSAFPTYLAWGPGLTGFYNDAYVPIMGDKPDGLGRPFPEVWSEVWDTIGPITERAMRGEASYFEDLPLTLMRRGYPEATWFSFSYSPIRDETGGVGGILCTVHETTQRVHAEAALRESEARLSAILDQLPLGVGLADPAGTITLGNRMLQRYTPLIPPDPRQAGRWRAYAPDGRPLGPADHPGARALRGETVVPGTDYIFTFPDGREAWTRVSAAPFLNAARERLGAILVVQDIDREKRAEERFREFAAHSTNAFWIANPGDRTLEYLNPVFETVFGTAHDAFRQDISRWIEVVHPEDRARVVEAFRKAALGVVSVEEFRITRADGAMRWIRNTFFPIRDEQGRARRTGGIAQDITRHEGRFVYVVDADGTTRAGLSRLLREAGHDVRAFPSGKAFLESAPALVPGCVVLDIRHPGAGGLAIPRELKARRIGLPVVVLGDAGGDVGFGVTVMKAGAVDFLPLPYRPEDLSAAVASALADIRQAEGADHEAGWARARIAEMSAREREVLGGILAGRTNKQIGRDLGISPRTVETYRAHVMQRLGAKTVPDAVRMAASAGVEAPLRSTDGT